MPRLIVTERAVRGIERCRTFLADKNPRAAQRAGAEIVRQLRLLEHNAAIGRPFALDPDLRELVIAFGATGYVALYRHDVVDDGVYVLAFRHQREAGY
uniref:type II toxin-antitoxin system RelE/ParE family toxin n=1 Tax=uncultured Sphingomonas sp. TaxID=158754 RepID=UPI0035C9C7A2